MEAFNVGDVSSYVYMHDYTDYTNINIMYVFLEVI